MKFRAAARLKASDNSRAGGRPAFRHSLAQCNLGFLNACSLRSSFPSPLHAGLLVFEGDEKIEILKLHMLTRHFYALALSEVRLPHTGAVEVGGGHVLLYVGGRCAHSCSP